MKYSKFVLVMLAAAALALPVSVRGQQLSILPAWTDNNQRSAAYPTAVWLTGYASGKVGSNEKPEQVQQRVVNQARSQLAEAIIVNIQREGINITDVDGLGSDKEKINRKFGEMIKATTSADLAMVDVEVHHDQKNNTFYAFAKTKKADLAGYYAGRIDFYLQVADNDLKLAKQHNDNDRKRSALEKIAEAKSNIAESGKHYDMLLALGSKNDAARLKDRSAQLERNIAGLENTMRDTGAIFLTGRETIGNSEANNVIPALQSLFSQNGCRVANSRANAQYVLTIDVRDHMRSQAGNFSYCYAQVRADVLNTKTGKTDANLNFTGPKASWTNMDRACQNAMNEAAKQMWKEISTKTELCK
ncbi:MAG: hypothetical protein FWB85_02965 [Chitinispirillia bacterium]|nr:hypothetical protein [Chitinispirillia bacterium]